MREFFALWPEPALRTRLASIAAGLHAGLGGRITRPDTLHLTLVFIGEVDEERQPTLLEVAAGAGAPAFEVFFDRLHCWHHNRIAHLAASQTPAALADLVRQLEHGLDAVGIARDKRPYVPHITLLRQADCAKLKPAPMALAWPARDFVLVKSNSRPGGVRYEELGRWPLL
jgi:2'-5' RNA ligase